MLSGRNSYSRTYTAWQISPHRLIKTRPSSSTAKSHIALCGSSAGKILWNTPSCGIRRKTSSGGKGIVASASTLFRALCSIMQFSLFLWHRNNRINAERFIVNIAIWPIFMHTIAQKLQFPVICSSKPFLWSLWVPRNQDRIWCAHSSI